MAAGAGNEDDWEYEYSTTENETFLVDLDLSSVNGVIRSKNSGDRKTLQGPGKAQKIGKDGAKPGQRATVEAGGILNEDDQENSEEDREDGDVLDMNKASQSRIPPEPGLLDQDNSGRMQILDFNTSNPIVSYNGHVYSCTWHDMLGTSMFISKHQDAPFHEPEVSTDDYDLIGTSRIKLVGHRARIVPKTGAKKRKRDAGEEDIDEPDPEPETTNGVRQYIPDGKSLGTITRTNPKTNIEIKQQANFLERLMEAKKTRGESDTVRTFVDRRTVAADARQARKAKRRAKEKEKEKEESTEKRLRREINELNKRVVKGDNDALERLQEIYADMEEVEDDEDEVLIGGMDTNANNTVSENNGQGTSNAGDSRILVVEGTISESPHVPGSDPNGASGSAPLN